MSGGRSVSEAERGIAKAVHQRVKRVWEEEGVYLHGIGIIQPSSRIEGGGLSIRDGRKR